MSTVWELRLLLKKVRHAREGIIFAVRPAIDKKLMCVIPLNRHKTRMKTNHKGPALMGADCGSLHNKYQRYFLGLISNACSS